MPGMDMSAMQGPSSQPALMICPVVLALIVASAGLALATIAMLWRDPHRALTQREIALALGRLGPLRTVSTVALAGGSAAAVAAMLWLEHASLAAGTAGVRDVGGGALRVLVARDVRRDRLRAHRDRVRPPAHPRDRLRRSLRWRTRHRCSTGAFVRARRSGPSCRPVARRRPRLARPSVRALIHRPVPGPLSHNRTERVQ